VADISVGTSRTASGARETLTGPGIPDDKDPSHTAVTMVIGTDTMARWDVPRAALISALSQDLLPAQVPVIVDHAAELAARPSRELHGSEALESDGATGPSGARNTGLKATTQDLSATLCVWVTVGALSTAATGLLMGHLRYQVRQR
jgi:hypothetical protein